MMCWRMYRAERKFPVISLMKTTILPYNYLTICWLHTNFPLTSSKWKSIGEENQADTEDKLDLFVKKIILRSTSKRRAKIHNVSQTSERSEKLKKPRVHTTVNKDGVRLTDNKKDKKHLLNGNSISSTPLFSRASQNRLQNLSFRDNLESDNVIVEDIKVSQPLLKHKNNVEDTKVNQPLLKNKEFYYQKDNDAVGQEHSLAEQNESLSNTHSNLTLNAEMKPETTFKKESCQILYHRPRRLSKDEQESLRQILSSGKVVEALNEIEYYTRQGYQVPFQLLRHFCGVACTKGLVDEVLRAKVVAEKSHRHLYNEQLCLDNYLASAICYNGNFSASLDKLVFLCETYPRGMKKIKDTTNFIIYKIMNTNELENEQMVLKFVKDLAEQKDLLSPALTLWRISFASTLHRLQKMAENLVESYPSLIEMLPQKLDGIIRKAYSDADLELLHRTLQLLLTYELTNLYTSATTALLQLQCEMGDLRGANETIKFAHLMRIQLKPSSIQRVLALLHDHKKPVPYLLLQMKYRIPAKPSLPPKPPEFKYKF